MDAHREAETRLFSAWGCPIWPAYHVRKPRLPRPADAVEIWSEKHLPLNFDELLGAEEGNASATAVARLQTYFLRREFPAVTIVVGPEGSGKAALLAAFLGDMMQSMAPTPAAATRMLRTHVLRMRHTALADSMSFDAQVSIYGDGRPRVSRPVCNLGGLLCQTIEGRVLLLMYGAL
ncbi:unnamed protein product, partial [Phaeothamnion confervicola]